MRKLFLIPAFFVVSSVVVLFAQAPAAGKINTQWKCAPGNPVHMLPVPDAANHAYMIQQGKCTAASGEIAGIKEKEGSSTEFMDGIGDNGKGQGVFVATLASGDKITYSYTFTGVSKNNIMQSGANKWTISGGTGKFKGTTGSGTCTGKGTGDGGAIFDCVGTYAIGK